MAFALRPFGQLLLAKHACGFCCAEIIITPTPAPPTPSLVTVSPSTLRVSSGENILLRCAYTGTDAISATFRWTKGENRSLPRNSITINSNQDMLILSASPSNAGEYHCHVRHSSGESSDDACVGVDSEYFVFSASLTHEHRVYVVDVCPTVIFLNLCVAATFCRVNSAHLEQLGRNGNN